MNESDPTVNGFPGDDQPTRSPDTTTPRQRAAAPQLKVSQIARYTSEFPMSKENGGCPSIQSNDQGLRNLQRIQRQIRLPETCERALFERFLKAEAMILWTVRAAQTKDLPPDVLQFLRHHEEEESQHLRQFESLLGMTSHRKAALPRVSGQWSVLSVQLYGYETLGLQFAKLLVATRPDMVSIARDEETHVRFFENHVARILSEGGSQAQAARQAAQGLRRRLPETVDRYLEDESLTPYRDELRRTILDAIDARFAAINLR